jgi:predicted nucleic acid-binding protein
MIVVDASLILDLLLRTSSAEAIGRRLFRANETLHAPHLIDVEILEVLRRYWLNKAIDSERAGEAIRDFYDLPIERYAHELLSLRVWELKANLTAYDAVYLALAELLEAPLVTADSRMSKAPNARVAIEVIR